MTDPATPNPDLAAFRRILVVCDLSEADQQLIELDAATAHRHNAALTLLAVVDPPADLPDIARHAGRTPEQIKTRLIEDAEQRLAELRRACRDRRTRRAARRHRQTVRRRHPAGARRRYGVGIPGLLIGNTAEDTLNLVTCSVLTVKPPDLVCPLRPA